MSPTMSTYFSGIAVLMIVLCPLLVPVAITLAPTGVLGNPSCRVGRNLPPLPSFALIDPATTNPKGRSRVH